MVLAKFAIPVQRPPERGSVAEQEVEHVHAGVGFGAVDLGVAAVDTGYGDEFLVLHIEKPREGTSGGLKLVGLIFIAAAFGADILFLSGIFAHQ